MKIHHIGYLVDKIEKAITEMQELGFQSLGEISKDELRKIYVNFMEKDGYVIELIQPIDEKSPMYSLRKKYKNSPYHICFETENLQNEIDKKCNGGGVLINKGTTKSSCHFRITVGSVFDELADWNNRIDRKRRAIMLKQFLSIVAKKNPYQEKFLKASLEDITVKEVQKLENLIDFYHFIGNSIEEIAEKYLYQIDFMMEDQKYFIENGIYRFSTFAEAESYYRNPEYMNSYVVGLGLTTYLWDTHREVMRFFLKQCSQLPEGGRYLEIGPGHGEYFVTAMQNTKFDSYLAVDISETSVKMTKYFCKYSLREHERKTYSVLHKDFFSFFPTENFEAIVMGEVLEHVEEPIKFLKKISDLATENAFIFVTTAINAPQPDHIYHFHNLQEILDLFQEANLIVSDQICLPTNGVSMEKAIKKKYAIVAGFKLKKGSKNE